MVATTVTVQVYPYIFQKSTVAQRVPGLPIRDCAGSSNNRGPRWPKLIAVDVTAKTFFERLYLVSGLTPIYAPCNNALGAHTHTVHSP